MEATHQQMSYTTLGSLDVCRLHATTRALMHAHNKTHKHTHTHTHAHTHTQTHIHTRVPPQSSINVPITHFFMHYSQGTQSTVKCVPLTNIVSTTESLVCLYRCTASHRTMLARRVAHREISTITRLIVKPSHRLNSSQCTLCHHPQKSIRAL